MYLLSQSQTINTAPSLPLNLFLNVLLLKKSFPSLELASLAERRLKCPARGDWRHRQRQKRQKALCFSVKVSLAGFGKSFVSTRKGTGAH